MISMKLLKFRALRIFTPVLLLFTLFNPDVFPQNNLRSYVNISVVPDKPGWNYRLGEKVIFDLTVTKFGQSLNNIEIICETGPEKMAPLKKETLRLQNGKMKVDGGTMKTPGFLRCQVYATVDGITYEDYATAAFEPEKIRPVAELPADFNEFWNKAKEELSQIPLNPILLPAPEYSTENVNVFFVNYANIRGRIYGILCVPKKEGKYPAVLSVPGAGIRPYTPDIRYAEKGIISLQIGIHGIPVNLPQAVYTELGTGALRDYFRFNLDDRDNYYYKRVYLGCVRSVDFIFSLPRFNGRDIAVTGGSQGGGLSLVTAGLDQRIKYLGAWYPALCDLTGYLHERAGGWPGLFRDEFTNKPEKVRTAAYFDAVNFARSITVPGFYSWGYNDNVCPPTSMFAAYNVITAPKELFLALDTRHWTYPEQIQKINDWLIARLTGNPGK
jgi:cephalosporin-C deacetylase-like acetyl esterase